MSANAYPNARLQVGNTDNLLALRPGDYCAPRLRVNIVENSTELPALSAAVGNFAAFAGHANIFGDAQTDRRRCFVVPYVDVDYWNLPSGDQVTWSFTLNFAVPQLNTAFVTRDQGAVRRLGQSYWVSLASGTDLGVAASREAVEGLAVERLRYAFRAVAGWVVSRRPR
ncbi:hypothetical protein V3W47_16615 [Deinococcus sp. YIM 134068]|uniref:hypothetical protein n=1 Tax=Deinococcus lichenicola TaxID=3118910 RepID=UPI002F9264FB